MKCMLAYEKRATVLLKDMEPFKEKKRTLTTLKHDQKLHYDRCLAC